MEFFVALYGTTLAFLQVAGEVAQQVPTTAAQAMAQTTTSDVSLNVVIGYIVIHVIEWIKNAQGAATNWLSHTSPAWVQRLVGAAAALLAALGINYTFDPTTGTLVISGLIVTSIVHLAWEWIKQYIAQQLMYRIALAPRMPTSSPS